MTRRNADDRLRELERRVTQGDLSALLLLHQQRKRTGQRREHYESPSFVANAPGLGDFMISPQDERTIFVRFGTRERVGSGDLYSRQEVDFPPFVIRGVGHDGLGHFMWYEGEGFVPLGPAIPGRTYREDTMRSIDRAGVLGVRATHAARQTILARLTPAVNAWAAAHRREMLEAEAGKASNAVLSTDKKVDAAVEALEEAQQELSAALLREIEVEEALRGVR